MTIAVAIRTSSALVFAADSKVTLSVIGGLDPQGQPIWMDQTYDNATKVVHDRNQAFMAMVAGHANLGSVAATDFLSAREFPQHRHFSTLADQEAALDQLIADMVAQKTAYWATTQVAPAEWFGPTVLLATLQQDTGLPRTLKLDLSGGSFTKEEILAQPWIYLAGTFPSVYSLLYGFEPTVIADLITQLGIQPASLEQALSQLRVLQPIGRIHLWGMPEQDAVDLAVFLATVQVQMDRFLPGTPACGGPIDVMVLRTAPRPGIEAFPGKALHHPLVEG